MANARKAVWLRYLDGAANVEDFAELCAGVMLISGATTKYDLRMVAEQRGLSIPATASKTVVLATIATHALRAFVAAQAPPAPPPTSPLRSPLPPTPSASPSREHSPRPRLPSRLPSPSGGFDDTDFADFPPVDDSTSAPLSPPPGGEPTPTSLVPPTGDVHVDDGGIKKGKEKGDPVPAPDAALPTQELPPTPEEPLAAPPPIEEVRTLVS